MWSLILGVCTRRMCVRLLLLTFVNVVRRVPATIIVGLVTFLVGLGSALSLDMLVNQV